MASVTNYARNFILDHIFRGDGSFPSNWYLALCVSSPLITETDISARESGYTTYVRVAIPRSTSGFGLATSPVGFNAQTLNANDTIFPVVESGADALTHWAICDALTTGNCWFFGTIDTGSGTPSDDVLVVYAGDIDIDLITDI